MGAQGQTTINFGAIPGTDIATVAVIGQVAILGGSLTEAWLAPIDTVDHSADEHLVDGPRVYAGAPTAGVGFTIYAVMREQPFDRQQIARGRFDVANRTLTYGIWTVNWVWN